MECGRKQVFKRCGHAGGIFWAVLSLCAALWLPAWAALNPEKPTLVVPLATVQPADENQLTLANGQTIKLAYTTIPKQQTNAKAVRQTWQDFGAVSVTIVGEDRYGHTLAVVAAPHGTLQGDLLAAGAAYVHTYAAHSPLHGELLAAEAQARQAKRGLWGSERWHVRDASTCCHAADIGRFQVVQGAVQQVAKVRDVVYLNFGPDWRTDFTVEVPPTTQAQFGDFVWESLIGRTARIRGSLKPINGTLLTLYDAVYLEMVD